jgi:DNA polymerase III epsilon subunit-like protein
MPVVLDADELVAHNGDKFDLKWLNTRLVYHGFDPKPIERTVDTLAIARRRFMFNSNRLDYIGQFLGLGQKIDTGGIELWKDIVLNKDAKAMAKMVRYCKQDVKLLEQVYHKLADYHNPKTHVGVHVGNERWSCPSCGSENVRINKVRMSALGIPRYTMHCNDCGKYHTISQSVYQQYLEAKHS